LHGAKVGFILTFPKLQIADIFSPSAKALEKLRND